VQALATDKPPAHFPIFPYPTCSLPRYAIHASNFHARSRAMTTTAYRVTDEALSLPVDARLSLVEKLLTSLNPVIDDEHERLWAEEAERRIAQLNEGKAKLVPGDEVFAKLRAKYAK
jgi:putative addiction module component (TIGR02574 family)